MEQRRILKELMVRFEERQELGALDYEAYEKATQEVEHNLRKLKTIAKTEPERSSSEFKEKPKPKGVH